MPTDEQLRVQSEKWATADHMKDLWDELKARDAEVQRLLTALTNMFAAFDDPFTTAQVEAHQSAVMLLAEYLPEKEAADAD